MGKQKVRRSSISDVLLFGFCELVLMLRTWQLRQLLSYFSLHTIFRFTHKYVIMYVCMCIHMQIFNMCFSFANEPRQRKKKADSEPIHICERQCHHKDLWTDIKMHTYGFCYGLRVYSKTILCLSEVQSHARLYTDVLTHAITIQNWLHDCCAAAAAAAFMYFNGF